MTRPSMVPTGHWLPGRTTAGNAGSHEPLAYILGSQGRRSEATAGLAEANLCPYHGVNQVTCAICNNEPVGPTEGSRVLRGLTVTFETKEKIIHPNLRRQKTGNLYLVIHRDHQLHQCPKQGRRWFSTPPTRRTASMSPGTPEKSPSSTKKFHLIDDDVQIS